MRKSKKKTSRKVRALVETASNREGLEKRILAFMKTKDHAGFFDIAQAIDASLKDIGEAVQALSDKGYKINLDESGLHKQKFTPTGGFESHYHKVHKGGWLKIGLISDNQLGNKTSRLDVLHSAYDHFADEGITDVYHAGNVIDGYLPQINAYELLPEAGPSIERQCEYAAKVYPKKRGITTHFVTGDCHEGWYSRGSGLNVGEAMQQRFEKHGRSDLVYKGHVEFDIELRPDGLRKDLRGPILRVMHPGGGTSYAKSYKGQKWAESLQGGEKPQIALIGHYHKLGYFLERNIHVFLAGCTSDQSIFMRKLQLQAEVGYRICEVAVDPRTGAVARIREELVTFFDKGYYQSYERF
jgi:hypothetical protein